MAIALALKALLLIALAALAALALPRAPATRHRLWRWTVAALLLLPLSPLLPSPLAFELPERFGASALAVSGSDTLAATALLALWALGTLALLLRLALSLAAAFRLGARARPVLDPERLAEVVAVERELGLRPRARLRLGGAGVVPHAFGFAPPQLVLPADAERWSPAERRAVLLHELTHVGRRDWLWQLLAAVATALWWPLPPVWWLARRLHLDGERACDEAVLRAGVPASTYAELLLAFARRDRRPAVAALVRRSQLGRRIAALLEPSPAVRHGRRWPLALLALATLALLGLRAQPPAPAVAAPIEPDPLALIGPAAEAAGPVVLGCDALGLAASERCRVLTLVAPGGDWRIVVRVEGDALPGAATFDAALAEIASALRRRYAAEPDLPTWVEEQEFGL